MRPKNNNKKPEREEDPRKQLPIQRREGVGDVGSMGGALAIITFSGAERRGLTFAVSATFSNGGSFFNVPDAISSPALLAGMS